MDRFRRASSQTPQQATTDDERHDERLLVAARGGDIAAFNQFVARHERAVFNVCLRMLGDWPSAEDATQDAFLKAWSSIRSFKGGLGRAWMLRIATNHCYDVLRSRTRRPTVSLDDDPAGDGVVTELVDTGADDPSSHAARVELSTVLENALARLPDDQRLALILCDVQGYSLDEAAAICDVPIGTIKSRLSRGRARMRDALRSRPDARELLERRDRFQNE